MNSKYLLSIPFTTDKHSGILIKKEDDLHFNIGENYIKLNYNETRRKGSFEVINQDKPSLIDFYNNLKNVINTMSLYNSQYTNWNIKLESYDENEITEKIIELKPTKITKDENQWEITAHLNFNIEMELTEAIASITVSSIIEDIKNIYNQIDENCQIKNKTTILDIYKNSFFQEKSSRFLSHVNILELLTTKEHVSKNQEECLNDLIKIVDKNYEDKMNKDEINSLKSKIGSLKRKSISEKVVELPSKHDVYITSIEYSKEMLKASYNVRSYLAHEGKLLDEFDECYNFLDKFIPKLLQKILVITH